MNTIINNPAIPETVTSPTIFAPAHLSESSDSAGKKIEIELKLTKEAMIALQGKISGADEKIENLASELASLRVIPHFVFFIVVKHTLRFSIIFF